MNRAIQCVISFFFLLGAARAQQIGSVDLSRAAPSSTYSEALAKTNGCSRFTPGMIADGIVGLGQQPREITVKLVSVSDEKPTEGSVLQGEIELRNTGTEPIEIPWSTDPGVITSGQDPNRLEWEVATFEVLFSSDQDSDSGGFLKSLTANLYGSKFTAGSRLTVQPGQWVTATVRFKLEAMYLHVPGEFKDGPLRLSAKWEQTARKWSVKDCVVSNFYAQYDTFYNQQKSSLLIDVKGAGSPSDKGRPPNRPKTLGSFRVSE
jgi:hypothetical protein